jgi:pyruvate/2-oxoglutarate dehydrogenase complex dihydrolipoamide acyltransferase (E2) component
VTIKPVARERRHTLYFLTEVRRIAPVFLDTEADMTEVLRHRGQARLAGDHYSMVSYVLHAAGRVLATHPEANAAFGGRLRPRVMHHPTVTGKLTLDKTVNGQRAVLATMIPDLGHAGIREIQAQVDRYRDSDPDRDPEFAAVRALHRLPLPVGALAFRLTVRPLRNRATAFGTFAVTSLGHRPVDGFYSVGGTTITLGVGRVNDRPVVRDGEVTKAPLMRLTLTFDHRVIDGAEAADVLAEIKDRLEGPQPVADGAPLEAAQADAQ